MTSPSTERTGRFRHSGRTDLRGGRNLPDRVFQGLALAAGLTVLVVLGLILFSTTREAWPAFRQEGFRFVTSSQWIPSQGKFGALALVYGTLVVSAVALLLAVPISIGLALFITELAPRAVRAPVVYLVDLLAAIPSVVYGLWGLLVFGPADAMAAVIANQFGEASGIHRAALIGLGVVLFVMTVLVNLLARAVTSRADRRLAGGTA